MPVIEFDEITEIPNPIQQASLEAQPTMLDKIGDMFTGNLRETEFSENLPELKGIFAGEDPVETAKLLLPILTTSDNSELAKIITSNMPNIIAEQDEKGNIYLGNRNNGVITSLNKPGFSKLDLMQTLGIGAAFMQKIPFLKGLGTGALTAIGKQAAKDTGIEAAIEANQSAQGGEFNPENVALTAVGSVLPDSMILGAKKLANNASSSAQKAIKEAEALEALRMQNPLSSEAQGERIINGQDALLNAQRHQEESTINAFKKAANSPLLRQPKLKTFSEEVLPDGTVIDSAKEFGLDKDLLPSHYSQNPTYVEIEQGLKSIPGSQLARQEHDLITKMGNQADQLVKEAGGDIDVSSVSDEVRDTMLSNIQKLSDEEEIFYSKLDKIIPKDIETTPSATLDFLEQQAVNFGGVGNLPEEFRSLVEKLSRANDMPTFAHLNQLRKDIGSKIKHQNFTSEEQAKYKLMYGLLSEDVDREIAKFDPNLLPELELNQARTVKRKALEKQADNVLGRELNKAVMPQLSKGILNLGLRNGDASGFDKIIKKIPPELRQKSVATALTDVFTTGSRKEKQLSLMGFDDWYQGIKRNKSAYNRFKQYLPEDSIRRMNLFGNLVKGVRNAKSKEITTGRIQGLLDSFAKEEGMLSKLYKVGRAEAVGSMTGFTGVGTAASIPLVFFGNKTTRTQAADKFIADPNFIKMTQDLAAGKFKSDIARKVAEKKLAKSEAFNNLLKAMPESERSQVVKDIVRSGLITWLTNE